MSAQLPVEDALDGMATAPVAHDVASPAPRDPARRSAGAKLRTLGVAAWKYLAGVVCCQSVLLGVVTNGWAYRLAQRAVLKRWWKMGGPPGATTFDRFLEEVSREGDHGGTLAAHRAWPNWIVARSFTDAARAAPEETRRASPVATALKALFASLWLNLKVGAQGILNTWVLTLPGCALWAAAWFGGWNNSFAKGYELAAVGPLTGLLGVALFIAAMLFVPIAQARQAATGNWRRFYDLRLVRRLIRHRSTSCLLLALLYSLASVPLTVLLVVPAFFPQISPELALLPDAEALDFLARYYFQVSLAAFPAFVLLRLAAARVYATGIATMVRTGAVEIDELAPLERDVLVRVGIGRADPAPARGVLLRAAGWTTSRAGRLATFALVVAIWFSFAAQIFIGQFFFYRPYQGWLNQPLVQLPYIPSLPGHLKEAAGKEEAGSN